MMKAVYRALSKAALAALLLAGAGPCPAQPDLTLSLADFMSWQPTTVTTQNISQVPLAIRYKAPNYQLAAGLDTNVKVLYAPDGMDNFGPYIDSAAQFNLFNFSHWESIDILTWFGGSAGTPVIVPSKAWVDAAHKNGVKVIGSVFMAPAAFGGSEAIMQSFLQKDAGNRFIAVSKLKQIAEYYHFDGWILNFETSVGNATGALAAAFVDSLHSNYSGEVIWYDAMLQNGSVSYQNMLNNNNAYFFRRSTGLFTNYNWSSANTVSNSASNAAGMGESAFKVYTGADMWPSRNAQPAFSSYNWIERIITGNVAKTSIAVFAMNFTFNYGGFSVFNNDASDYARFYAAERKIFAGVDQDPFTADNNAWKGLNAYIPVRTTLRSLPFETDFNTGHGLNYYHNGSLLRAGAWHNMSHQASLPSWTFFTEGLTIDYDFDEAYSGGSSLQVAGNAGQYDLPLYSCVLAPGALSLKPELAYRSTSGTVDSVTIRLRRKDGLFRTFAFRPAGSGSWESLSSDLQPVAATDTFIAINLGIYATGAFELNIGRMNIAQAVPNSLAALPGETALKVYPNPTTGTVYFSSPGRGQLRIYDLEGRMIADKKTGPQPEMCTLPAAGVYMYEWSTDQGFKKDKIIVTR